jgi:hypothetical protein
MKQMLMILLTLLLTSPLSPAAESESGKYYLSNYCWHHFDDFRTEFDDDAIIFYHGEDGDRVKITDDCLLYINDRLIETTEEQQGLLCEYYGQLIELTEKAGELGLKGAGLGIRGAEIGLLTAGTILELIFSGNFDEDYIESRIEIEVEDIEKAADELEEEAEELERIADQLEDLSFKLKYEINELDELDWF